MEPREFWMVLLPWAAKHNGVMVFTVGSKAECETELTRLKAKSVEGAELIAVKEVVNG